MSLFHIEPEIRPWLAAADCVDFATLARAPIGDLCSVATACGEVRRFTVSCDGQERTLFLKRSRGEEVSKMLRPLVNLQWPAVGAMREVALLAQLRDAGFATMQPIAWGQRSVLGWPIEGFLICEATEGIDAHDLRQSADAPTREKLQRSFGHLIGRLHAHGFFQPVRLKDVICRFPDGDANASGDADDPFGFVLIDRATSKPWTSRFSLGKCRTILRRMYRRMTRDDQTLVPAELTAFAKGYCTGLADHTALPPERVMEWLTPAGASPAKQLAKA